MLIPIRHALDYGRYFATKRSSDRADTEALRELEQRKPQLPAGLDITWLGTAGYRISYQGQTILIDPFLTRVPLSTVIRRRTALPDPSSIDRFLPRLESVAAVLIGHGHWDHALDAPAVARRFRSPVYGSTSVAKLMGLHGLSDLSVAVEPYHRYEIGPFEVTFVPSLHSKIPFGTKVPSEGDTGCASLDGLAPMAYGCGQTWGIHIAVDGFDIYRQGSADLIDGAIVHHGVDLFLAGIAGRSVTPDYWPRILGRLRPDTVVAMHYDNFLTPLDAPMGYTPNVRIADVEDEIATVSRDIRVVALPQPFAVST